MRELWIKFKQGLFTKTQFLTGVTLSFIFVSGFIYAFNQLNLTIFTKGTTISAAQVNANFEYVNERIQAIADYSQGFSVRTSGPTNFGTVPRTVMQTFSDGTNVGTVCCPQYPRVGNFFDDYDPNQVSNRAADYIANQYYEVQEDGFYMMHYSAKPSIYHNSSAYAVIYKKSPSSTAINTFAGRDYGWTSVSTGASVSRYLRSGDKVFFNIRVPSGAGTFSFEPGIQFTIKKL